MDRNRSESSPTSDPVGITKCVRWTDRSRSKFREPQQHCMEYRNLACGVRAPDTGRLSPTRVRKAKLVVQQIQAQLAAGLKNDRATTNRPVAAVHPNDLPQGQSSAPNTGDANLDRRYQGEQDNLAAKQIRNGKIFSPGRNRNTSASRSSMRMRMRLRLRCSSSNSGISNRRRRWQPSMRGSKHSTRVNNHRATTNESR
jgi:hypothetical protein